MITGDFQDILWLILWEMTLHLVYVNFWLSSLDGGNVFFHVDLVIITVVKEMIDYFEFPIKGNYTRRAPNVSAVGEMEILLQKKKWK